MVNSTSREFLRPDVRSGTTSFYWAGTPRWCSTGSSPPPPSSAVASSLSPPDRWGPGSRTPAPTFLAHTPLCPGHRVISLCTTQKGDSSQSTPRSTVKSRFLVTQLYPALKGGGGDWLAHGSPTPGLLTQSPTGHQKWFGFGVACQNGKIFKIMIVTAPQNVLSIYHV